MKLVDQIENYHPFNEQEKMDKMLILHCLKNENNIFCRENAIAHMTASAWVVNSTRTKVLMAYHNIYRSWAWLGGHADGEQDLLQVAIREVQEESGLRNICSMTDEVFSIEVLTVDGHMKRGTYVSSHLHLNVTYLLEANEEDELCAKADENSNVSWFCLDDAIKASSEPWFQENIYKKLNQKLSDIFSGKSMG